MSGTSSAQSGWEPTVTRQSIRDHLEVLRNERIVFRPNPGTAGDSLIQLATFELFDELGLQWEFYDDSIDVEGRVVVYGGGGNLVPLYQDCTDFLGRVHERAGRLVVLPHTVAGNDSLMLQLGSNVKILCREETSLKFVRGAAPNVGTALIDDLAFTLDPEAILGRSLRSFSDAAGKLSPFDERRVATYNKKTRGSDRRRGFERLLGRTDVLRCFRSSSEAEQCGRSIPWGNIDLSQEIPHDPTARSRRSCAETAYKIFRSLSVADEIRTDRLHMAIAGALLGKRVRLHRNAYFKNRAVYDFSFASRFPNVEWVED